MKYEIIKDNLVNLKDPVQAIVNSSNPFISRGGGVCGAIHKVAGFEFTKYCINLGGLTIMQSKISPGFNLPYKYVIHTLAPMYKKSKNPKEELINTYLNAINLARENNIQSIAFPILGAGHFGYPLDIAIDCALNSFKQIYDNSISIKLVCYTEEEYTIAKKLII